MIGARLGPYEIVGKLGEGGMGEVYRAHDTALDRDVALKVVSIAFANDPDRLMRFEREARTLAALNHPHIAQIYGLERSGDVQALVMELVEGQTLADRLADGPLPLEDAVPLARQIAGALEAAHEHGIVHRDLKPANIKVRDDGTVKVLDFGLAKVLDPSGSSLADPARSPTMTSPAMTAMGVILGTAAYMSPEQARGRPVDRRADIWAFGCVLYEMLSGRRLFQGETISDTLAALLRQEVDLGSLPADTPATLRGLIARCLDRDPATRLRDIGEARILLSDPSGSRSGVLLPASAGPATSGISAGPARSAQAARPRGPRCGRTGGRPSCREAPGSCSWWGRTPTPASTTTPRSRRSTFSRGSGGRCCTAPCSRAPRCRTTC